MRKQILSTVFAILVALSMVVGCTTGAPAQPTAAPVQPTTAPAQPTAVPPKPTAAPTAVPPTPVPTVAKLDTLIISQSTDATTLEPAEVNSRSEANIAQHLFDALIKMDAKQQLKPMLAESWKMLDDKMTWQFKLRKDVKFWDGEPFNAQTVKFCFERAADPANKFVGNTAGYVFPSIGFKSVEVVDDYTVNIILDRFEPDTPGYISEIYIHSVKWYKDNPKEKVATTPMGSGPYKLKEWKKDDRIVLERWDDYWGPKPTFKTLVWRAIPEASTSVAELLAGSVHVMSKVPPDQSAQVDKSKTARMATITGGRRIYVGFQQKCTGPGCKEVKDVRVRQALNYAVDVDKILKNLFSGQGVREGGMVNPPHKSADIKAYPYDPEKAKKLLAEAGYPNGFKATLATPNGRYQKDKDIALAVAADLAKVGVQAEVVPYEWSVYTQMTKKKELPALFLLGTGSDFLSAWYDLSDLVNVGAATNYVNWQNSDWDKLVKQLGETYDPAERKKITDKLQMIVHDDAPWLFIYMQVDWYAVSNLVNWSPRADEVMDFVDAKLK